jgi:hypothetical protein
MLVAAAVEELERRELGGLVLVETEAPQRVVVQMEQITPAAAVAALGVVLGVLVAKEL